MPNFRDPRLLILSLLVALLSVAILTTSPPALARASGHVVPLKLAGVTPRVSAPLWQPPFGSSLHVVRPFLRPTSDWGAGHRGVDLVASKSVVLLAPHRAKISFANQAFGVPTVVLDHNDGSSQVFQPVCLLEDNQVGQELLTGQTFGVFCGAGLKEGHCGQLDCIHWSYRLDKSTYINPLRMIGWLAPASLLPTGQIDTASAT